MFKHKKKKTGCETPTYSRFSMAPEPIKPSKPNPNYIPPASVKSKNELCTYETPCGWCTKWDKKCDKKIGCENDKSQRGLRAESNVYEDNCHIPKGIIRKIIQEVVDYEKAMNELKEITKGATNEYSTE